MTIKELSTVVHYQKTLDKLSIWSSGRDTLDRTLGLLSIREGEVAFQPGHPVTLRRLGGEASSRIRCAEPAAKGWDMPQAIHNIVCRSCNASLDGFPCSKPRRTKALPSPYWMELIDCWSCHQSEFAVVTNGLSFSRDGSTLLPSNEDILYRNFFLILKLDVGTGGECKMCKSELGFMISENFHYKLFLDRIILNSNPGDPSLPMAIKDVTSAVGQSSPILNRVVLSFLVLEIIEHIDSCSSVKFLIRSHRRDASTKADCLYLQVLSWNSYIFELDTEAENSSPFRPALFIRSIEETDDHEDDRVSLTWPSHHFQVFKDAMAEGLVKYKILGLDQVSILLF